MWKFVNSPIVITIVLIAAIISYDQLRKNSSASEIRAVYEEVLAISEDATGDLEKKKVISSFVKEASKQMRQGFSSFGNDVRKNKQAKENKHYFEVKKQIQITKPKVMETKKYNKIQKVVIYQVKNNSSEYLSKVGHTIEFYYKGDLLELKEEWGHIKLAPGETKSYAYKIENENLVFTNIKMTVGDISIMPVADSSQKKDPQTK